MATITATPNREKGEIDFDERAEQVAEEIRKEEQDAERAKKNHNFFMVFKEAGGPALRKLIDLSPSAAQLFLYISEVMGRDNALVASGIALAKGSGLSEASVSRALTRLEEDSYLMRFKSGGSNVLVINPKLVWNSWATGKETCLFNRAKVLIAKGEQDETMIKRFQHLIEKRAADHSALGEDAEQRAELEKRGQRRIPDA